MGVTPKDVVEAVKVKLSLLESGEGCTVQLTVGRPAGQPQEASTAKAGGEEAALAAAPAAEHISKAAAGTQESQAPAPKAPAEVTLPEALLPEVEGAIEEGPAAEAGTGTPAAAASEKPAVPEPASGAAADVPAPTAASPPAAEDEINETGEELAAIKADATGEAPPAAGNEAEVTAGTSADADAVVEVPEKEASDDTAVPQQVEVSKETAPVVVAEPLEESNAEPALHKSSLQEEAKVEEVVAVLSSNVSAVVEAETKAPASIEVQPQAEEEQSGEDTALEAGELGPSSSAAKEPAAAVAQDVIAAKEQTGTKVPKDNVHMSSTAAAAAEDATEVKEADAAADSAPVIADAPSEAAEEGQSEQVIGAAGEEADAAADAVPAVPVVPSAAAEEGQSKEAVAAGVAAAAPAVEEAERESESKDGAAGAAQEVDGKAMDAGQTNEIAAVPAQPKEGTAKKNAADAEEDKPKQQTSMFKSALKMFQGK